MFNLESTGVRAPGRRPRHDGRYTQPTTESDSHLFDGWFDPIETGIRDRVRGLIEVLLAIKQRGGESTEAWRTVLDDLIKRGFILAALLL